MFHLKSQCMQLWIKNCSLALSEIQDYSLIVCHRKLQWILKHIMWMAPTAEKKKQAAFELCRNRDLCSCLESSLINDVDPVTGETPLITLCANGGNIEDIKLLVAAGADINTKSSSHKMAIQVASEHGHDRFVDFSFRSGNM